MIENYNNYFDHNARRLHKLITISPQNLISKNKNVNATEKNRFLFSLLLSK